MCERLSTLSIDLRQEDRDGQLINGTFDVGSFLDGLGLSRNLAVGYAYDTLNQISYDVLRDIENVVGGDGNDMIYGNSLTNVLEGGDGDDTIYSGGDVEGFSTGDRLYGGNGNDILHMQGMFVIARGGAGNDTITAPTDPGTGDFVYVSVDWDFFRVTYNTSPAGIRANLTDSARTIDGTLLDPYEVADGFGGIDSVRGVHVVSDSDYDDIIHVGGANLNNYGGWIEVRLGTGDDHVEIHPGLYQARVGWDQAGDGVYARMDDGTGTGNGIAVDINLSNGDQIGTDTFFGITYFRGSAFGDHLVGDGSNNRLRGQAGDDILDGGGGRDRIEHTSSPNGVHVDLGQNLVIDDGYDNPGTDTLIGIEDVHGSLWDDLLLGDSGANSINGRSGNDTINGRAGNDTLRGSGGDDTFVFENGFGVDVVSDFNVASANEIINLTLVTEITNYADLVANHLSEVGGQPVITDGINTITLVGIDINALTASDFVFI